MKKIFSLALALALCLSLCACSSKADKLATVAFTNTDIAYDMTNEFSHDIYEAWYMGINEKDEITGKSSYYYTYDYEEGFDYFCDQLTIDREHIKDALCALTELNDAAGAYESLLRYADSIFSVCVTIVTKAYEVSGKTDEISDYIATAKDAILDLSKDGADYEHYEDLKYYLAETAAFYEFCCDPEGSFEQVVQTFNNYRNDARQYYNVLALFFEDPNKELSDVLESILAPTEEA